MLLYAYTLSEFLDKLKPYLNKDIIVEYLIDIIDVMKPTLTTPFCDRVGEVEDEYNAYRSELYKVLTATQTPQRNVFVFRSDISAFEKQAKLIKMGECGNHLIFHDENMILLFFAIYLNDPTINKLLVDNRFLLIPVWDELTTEQQQSFMQTEVAFFNLSSFCFDDKLRIDNLQQPFI